MKFRAQKEGEGPKEFGRKIKLSTACFNLVFEISLSLLQEPISRSKNDCIDMSLNVGRVITSIPSTDVKHAFFLIWHDLLQLKNLYLN